MIPGESEETTPEKTERIEEPVAEPEPDLAQVLASTKQKADEYLDSWKRAQADFINYKRRAEQERLEIGVYANTQLILSLLPILDDFERAYDSVTPKLAKTDWAEGIKLVARKLKATLEAQGLSAIPAVGETFDPSLHEAVMHVAGEDGKVVKELEKGYKLRDKVIRPSKVAVGNGKEIEEKDKENKAD